MSYLEEAISEFPDPRTDGDTRYSVRDAALAAFSAFFTQSPSFLAHQRSMQLSKVFEALHEREALDSLRCFDRTLLVALDGVWFHNSESVRCEHCNTQGHRDGRTTYCRSAVTRVISPEPQFIEPQDGATKQDCENAPGERWLCGAGPSYVEHSLTILGDDLYCNQPMCELLLEHRCNFIPMLMGRNELGTCSLPITS